MKKVAVITGTTSGIGRTIANFYVGAGFFVAGINRRAYDISDGHIDRNFLFDLSDPIETKAVVEEIKHQFKDRGIDVLVNNAGIMILDDLYDGAPETIATDFIAPMYLCKELLPMFGQGGHIINIASVSGIIGDPDVPIYSACKAGIINFTRSLAKITAPIVRVNCISPGFFDTDLVEGDVPQELIDEVPMRREAQTYEIISVIQMLQNSTYITGANIVIDGGLSL